MFSLFVDHIMMAAAARPRIDSERMSCHIFPVIICIYSQWLGHMALDTFQPFSAVCSLDELTQSLLVTGSTQLVRILFQKFDLMHFMTVEALYTILPMPADLPLSPGHTVTVVTNFGSYRYHHRFCLLGMIRIVRSMTQFT